MTFDAVCKPAYTAEIPAHDLPFPPASAKAPLMDRFDHAPDTKPKMPPNRNPLTKLVVVAAKTCTTRSTGVRAVKGIVGGAAI